MDKTTLYLLIDKYLDGSATPQERALLEEYYDRLEKISISNLSEDEISELKGEVYQNILRNISTRGKVIPLYRKPFFKVAVAAVFVLLASASYFLFFKHGNVNVPVPVANNQQTKDILPGRDAAVLTLADGRQIVLDTVKGTISTQGNTTVINLGGLLTYKQGDKPTEVTYNTISTARGNQYQLLLADGSKVWLNAATSLRFPTAFNGDDRTVELDGEAYFEVAHDPSKPFHVKTSSQDIQVLGTHFNVNSYKDEPEIKTTLLEGSVAVTSQKSKVKIRPGEQAILTSSGQLTTASAIDLDQVMAWKNGTFNFDGADLKTVMRQISRWYDVDIEYQGNVPVRTFRGEINRNVPASKVLQMLEYVGVHFKIENKKIVVTP